MTTPVRRTSIRPDLPDDFGRSAKTPRSTRSVRTYASQSVTPRAHHPRSASALSARTMSVKGKRAGTPAHDYLARLETGLPVDGLMGIARVPHDSESARYGEGNDTIYMDDEPYSAGGEPEVAVDRSAQLTSTLVSAHESTFSQRSGHPGRRPSGTSHLTAPSFHSRYASTPTTPVSVIASSKGKRRDSEQSTSLWQSQSSQDEVTTPARGNMVVLNSSTASREDSRRQVSNSSNGSRTTGQELPPMPEERSREMLTEDAGFTPSVKKRKGLLRRPSMGSLMSIKSRRSKSRPGSPK